MDRPATDVRVSESPAANESDYDFNSLAMVDSDGWPLQVSRYPGRSALLDLAQVRPDELRASGGSYGRVPAATETVQADESTRPDYHDEETGAMLAECIVLRAPLGESGLGYRLSFSHDAGGAVNGDNVKIDELTESFDCCAQPCTTRKNPLNQRLLPSTSTFQELQSNWTPMESILWQRSKLLAVSLDSADRAPQEGA